MTDAASLPQWMCKVCGSEKRTGVQYCLTIEDYDGVSEWQCEKCGVRVGRWTGKVLAEGELEPRYGVKR